MRWATCDSLLETAAWEYRAYLEYQHQQQVKDILTGKADQREHSRISFQQVLDALVLVNEDAGSARRPEQEQTHGQVKGAAEFSSIEAFEDGSEHESG